MLRDATYSYEYVTDSARVFYFDIAYGNDNYILLLEVPDHYPIHAEFKTEK